MLCIISQTIEAIRGSPRRAQVVIQGGLNSEGVAKEALVDSAYREAALRCLFGDY